MQLYGEDLESLVAIKFVDKYGITLQIIIR